jgi:hypothetical protein
MPLDLPSRLGRSLLDLRRLLLVDTLLLLSSTRKKDEDSQGVAMTIDNRCGGFLVYSFFPPLFSVHISLARLDIELAHA